MYLQVELLGHGAYTSAALVDSTTVSWKRLYRFILPSASEKSFPGSAPSHRFDTAQLLKCLQTSCG